MARLRVPAPASAAAPVVAMKANAKPARSPAPLGSTRAPNKTAISKTNTLTGGRKVARESRRCPWKEARLTGTTRLVRVATVKNVEKKKKIEQMSKLTAAVKVSVAPKSVVKKEKEKEKQMSKAAVPAKVTAASKSATKGEKKQMSKPVVKPKTLTAPKSAIEKRKMSTLKASVASKTTPAKKAVPAKKTIPKVFEVSNKTFAKPAPSAPLIGILKNGTKIAPFNTPASLYSSAPVPNPLILSPGDLLVLFSEDKDESHSKDLALPEAPLKLITERNESDPEELSFIPAPLSQPPPHRRSRSSLSRRISSTLSLGDSVICGGTPPPTRPPIIPPLSSPVEKRVRFDDKVVRHAHPGPPVNRTCLLKGTNSKAEGRAKMFIRPNQDANTLTLTHEFIARFKQLRRMIKRLKAEDPMAAREVQTLYGTDKYKVDLGFRGKAFESDDIGTVGVDGLCKFKDILLDEKENSWMDANIYDDGEDITPITLEKPDFDVPPASRAETAQWRRKHTCYLR